MNAKETFMFLDMRGKQLHCARMTRRQAFRLARKMARQEDKAIEVAGEGRSYLIRSPTAEHGVPHLPREDGVTIVLPYNAERLRALAVQAVEVTEQGSFTLFVGSGWRVAMGRKPLWNKPLPSNVVVFSAQR